MKLIVYELGEDGDAWFVEGAPRIEDAVNAIVMWLDDTLASQPSDRRQAQENLDAATAVQGRWWFATGHAEGQMVGTEDPPTWREGFRVS